MIWLSCYICHFARNYNSKHMSYCATVLISTLIHEASVSLIAHNMSLNQPATANAYLSLTRLERPMCFANEYIDQIQPSTICHSLGVDHRISEILNPPLFRYRPYWPSQLDDDRWLIVEVEHLIWDPYVTNHPTEWSFFPTLWQPASCIISAERLPQSQAIKKLIL